jgi:hypothetical protein
MKRKINLTLVAVAAIASLTLVFAALGQPKSKSTSVETPSASSLPLELDRKIPLSVNSHGVEWRSNTYHLVGLSSIQFTLDKPTGHLQGEIQAGLTTFDDVNYDISAAVFDASGTLLGTARTECKVERTWLGKVLLTQAKLALDFGNSLDYADANSFMINISRRDVLTPDQWKK